MNLDRSFKLNRIEDFKLVVAYSQKDSGTMHKKNFYIVWDVGIFSSKSYSARKKAIRTTKERINKKNIFDYNTYQYF